MSNEKSLGRKLSEVIWEHDPRIVESLDAEACAVAAAEVARVLGCLMATLTAKLPQGSEDELVAKLNTIMLKTSHKLLARVAEINAAAGHA